MLPWLLQRHISKLLFLLNVKRTNVMRGRKCFGNSWTFFSTYWISGWVLLYFTGCDEITWTRKRKPVNQHSERVVARNMIVFTKGTVLKQGQGVRGSYIHSVSGWHSDVHKWHSCHLMLSVNIKDILKYSPIAGLLMFHDIYIYSGQWFSAWYLFL